jgi:hypothetical protein
MRALRRPRFAFMRVGRDSRRPWRAYRTCSMLDGDSVDQVAFLGLLEHGLAVLNNGSFSFGLAFVRCLQGC